MQGLSTGGVKSMAMFSMVRHVSAAGLLLHYRPNQSVVAGMLGMATRIVSDYGKVLSRVEPGVYGLPESLLPHAREKIRMAITTLLKQIGPGHPEVKEGLRQGYVYLAQFVSDDEAEVVARGQASASGSGGDEGSAEPAMRIINRIKLDMERAVEDMRGFP